MNNNYKIALINPVSKSGVNHIPTGLAYLSSYLKKFISKEIDIKILNIGINSTNRVLEFNPDLVGITCFTHTFYLACDIAKKNQR